MLEIGKTVVLLLFEFVAEYMFGTMLAKLILKKESNPIVHTILGFFGYQALFEPIALAMVFVSGILHHLTIVWMAVLTGSIVLSVIFCKDVMKRQFQNSLRFLKQYQSVIRIVIVVVAAFCYYVCINGEDNEDARYYIALMTTSVDTDTMFQYNVYNGYQVGALYLRRIFATFEMHSAVLSQAFQIHPLVIARIFRACQNVILTSGAVYLCGKSLFWKSEQKAVEKSLFGVVAFWFLQLVCSNTIYMSGTFLLYRAYEAKAFTSNLVILFGLYLCAEQLRTKEIRMIGFFLLFFWGSMALSVSAVTVAGAECAILLIPVWMRRWFGKRKWERQNAGK